MHTEMVAVNLYTRTGILQLVEWLSSGWKTEDLPFGCWQGQAAFLSSKAPRHCYSVIPASRHWVTRASTLGVKRPGCEDDHVSPFHGKVKNEWGYTLNLLHAFMMCNIAHVLHYAFHTLHQEWVIGYYVKSGNGLTFTSSSAAINH